MLNRLEPHVRKRRLSIAIRWSLRFFADLSASSSEGAERSEPTTVAFGNFRAVNTAWFVPQPATQMRMPLPGKNSFDQSPTSCASICLNREASATDSKTIGGHG